MNVTGVRSTGIICLQSTSAPLAQVEEVCSFDNLSGYYLIALILARAVGRDRYPGEKVMSPLQSPCASSKRLKSRRSRIAAKRGLFARHAASPPGLGRKMPDESAHSANVLDLQGILNEG